MATFQDRANGGVTAKIRLKGHIESKTFYPIGKQSAKVLADEWASKIEKEIQAGVYKSGKNARTTTLLEAIDHYETEYASKNKGYQAEKYKINCWRNWKYVSNKLSELTTQKFDEYRDERRVHVKDQTIRLELAVISAVFSNTDYGIPNPALGTMGKLAPADKRNRRLQSVEQVYLLNALFDTKCSDPKRANHYLPLVAIFALETACRMSEIVKDAREHTTGVLRENIVLNKEKSVAFITNTKNGTSRYVPLSPIAVEAVERAYELDTSKTGAVFRTTASAVKQGWMRAKKRAIDQYHADEFTDTTFLSDFHFHDLRHEAASRWKKHFSVARLKDLTGHLDIRSLMRYLNSDQYDIEEMAGEMAEIQKQNLNSGDKRMVQFPEKKTAE